MTIILQIFLFLLINALIIFYFENLSKYFKQKDLNQIINFMISDKKNNSKKINLITLNKIGSVNIKNQLNPKEVKKFMRSALFE